MPALRSTTAAVASGRTAAPADTPTRFDFSSSFTAVSLLPPQSQPPQAQPPLSQPLASQPPRVQRPAPAPSACSGPRPPGAPPGRRVVYPRYQARLSLCLGISQVVAGGMCMMLNSLAIVASAAGASVGSGIWCGLFVSDATRSRLIMISRTLRHLTA